jgi:uncharacterized protein (DUF4415 family)
MMQTVTKSKPGRPPAPETREIISVRLPKAQVDWLKQRGATKTIEALIKKEMDKDR